MAGADRILFGSSLSGSLLLSAGQLEITEALEVVGPGADVVGIDADYDSRIFVTNPDTAGDKVEISGLSMAYGQTAGSGGAIYNDDAELTVESSFFFRNRAGSAGLGGGAIYDLANFDDGSQTTVESSSFGENRATEGAGGAIASSDQLGRIVDSTFITNIAEMRGGALYAETGGTIQNSTLIFNYSYDVGGGFATGGSGGPFPSIENSIFDNSTQGAAQRDLVGADPFQVAFSYVDDPSGATINDSVGGSNLLGGNPRISGTFSFDWPTPILLPQYNSPVLDKGRTAGGSTVDQRGEPRPFDGPAFPNSAASGADGSDMGAVELTDREMNPAGLSLEIVDTPDPAFVSDTVTYTFEVRNFGPRTATNVEVDSLLPDQLAFQTAGSSPDCTVLAMPGEDEVNCLFGSLVSGATATRSVSVTTLDGAALTPYVTVYSYASGDQLDPSTDDNFNYEDTTVRRHPTQSTPPPPVVTNPFDLGAAIKRCKKKFRGKQRGKCIKKARKRAQADVAGISHARRVDAMRAQAQTGEPDSRGLYRRFLGS